VIVVVALLAAVVVWSAERGERSGGDHRRGLRVEIGAEGFAPGWLNLPDGKAATVTFRRTSETTCARGLVFPHLNVERELPLGQDVAIDVPASAPRRMGFQCGAGPYRGKLLIN
jgi:plastocyanin domain-containing protein